MKPISIQAVQILHLINQHRLSGISKGELAEHFRVSKKTIYRYVNLGTCGFPIYGDQIWIG